MNTTPKYDNVTNAKLRLIQVDGPAIKVAPGATFEATLKNLVVNPDGRNDVEAYLDAGAIVKHGEEAPEPAHETAGEEEVETGAEATAPDEE